jgi:S-methylmethionine-dependent homocysteine/selenocysteine methylase
MTTYRNRLPQLSGGVFLTDGGLETTLVFQEGLELPEFAAFDLLKNETGREVIRDYFRRYVTLARKYNVGFILESATWRANTDWGRKIGYSDDELADMNRKAIDLLLDIRNEYETAVSPMILSGCIGPRGDGYIPSAVMSAEEAERYHAPQINVFRQTAADMVTAITMNYVEEAIGIARAARAADLPVAISFTVETDGKLPTGQSLKEAIERVDAATQNAPAYYMINCAHPLHFAQSLIAGEPWLERIRGLRANASTRSHAELNESTELDEGNPVEFGLQHKALLGTLKNLSVLGGCCGTDHRHVEELCKAATERIRRLERKNTLKRVTSLTD